MMKREVGERERTFTEQEGKSEELFLNKPITRPGNCIK